MPPTAAAALAGPVAMRRPSGGKGYPGEPGDLHPECYINCWPRTPLRIWHSGEGRHHSGHIARHLPSLASTFPARIAHQRFDLAVKGNGKVEEGDVRQEGGREESRKATKGGRQVCS